MCITTTDKKKIYTIYGLNEILDREEKIIIYGAGTYGKRIADYFISIGKQTKIETFWVTEKTEDDYRGIKIIESGDGHLVVSDTLIIIAVSQDYLSEIVEIVRQYGKRYCCVTEFLYNEIDRKLNPALTLKQIGTYEGLDFLLAGFVKCGTTSLHQALRKVEDIYVSENKESQFFSWCDKVENPKEQLIRDYFNNIRKGQIVGAIEPSFSGQAVRIREFFGKRVKILLLVRNPVDAAFSLFKMKTRNIGGGQAGRRVMEAYEKFGGEYKEGVFEEVCKGRGWSPARSYMYSDRIQYFLEYWKKDQIKIVIFEEMIENPRKAINEILQFVGSSCEYMYEDLPWANEGNYVMADIEGLEIASRRGKLIYEYRYLKEASGRNKEEIMDELTEIKKQCDQARKIYDLKLSEGERKMMEAYYNDSVRELERMLNRDLSEIWF